MTRFMRPILAISTALPGIATAATVNVPADQPTVRLAVVFSGVGDDIVVAAGDYSSEGVISFTKDLNISGAGVGLTTLPQLNPTSSVVEISDATLPCLERAIDAEGLDADTTLRDVEASGCTLADQLIYVEGNLFVDRSTFTNMETEGGGVILATAGAHSLIDVAFEDVRSVSPPACDPVVEICSAGAAATLVNSWTSILNGSFDACDAEAGACLYFIGGASNFPGVYGRFSIGSSTFSGSVAQTSIVYAEDFSELSMGRTSIIGNVSPGGVLVAEPKQDNDAVVAMYDVQMSANQVASVDAAAVVFKGVDFDVSAGDSFFARGSSFCGNENLLGPADLMLEGVDSVFVQGVALALGAGTTSTEMRGSTGDFLNVTFAGYDGPAILASNGIAPPAVTLNSTLFADLGGYAIESGALIAASGSYLGMHNTAGWSDAVSDLAFNTAAVEQDPLFQGYVDRVTTTCADVSLFLGVGSPMRDAGDPNLDTDLNGDDDLDPDGTTPDIGAYGGNLADLDDGDGDGVFEDLDCDDDDVATFPGAVEVPYDAIDQDCDGSDLEDVDGDGETAAVVGGPDCDDDDATINTAAVEIWYDDVDQNCDGADDFDQDGDGEQSDQHGGTDCDDEDESVNTAAVEIWYDDVDQDCAGDDDFDQDGDGYPSDAYGGIDCDDTDIEVGPGIDEVWYDGVDQDCDGNDDDQDGDGFVQAADCDDLDDKINPDALDPTEDGTDQDCDGVDGPGDDTGTKPIGGDSGGDDGGGCGCSATAGPGVGWWLFVLVAAVGGRRSPRRTASSGA